jgi:hypothetical protein
MAKRKKTVNEPMRALSGTLSFDGLLCALENFCSTIEATGGVFKDPENGYWYPVGDPTWFDLGDAYLAACEALRRKPLIADDDIEGDDQ